MPHDPVAHEAHSCGARCHPDCTMKTGRSSRRARHTSIQYAQPCLAGWSIPLGRALRSRGHYLGHRQEPRRTLWLLAARARSEVRTGAGKWAEGLSEPEERLYLCCGGGHGGVLVHSAHQMHTENMNFILCKSYLHKVVLINKLFVRAVPGSQWH